MSNILNESELDAAVAGLYDEELENANRCEFAWDILRHLSEVEHGFYLNSQQMNDSQIKLSADCIYFLLSNGATLGMLALEIGETLGPDKMGEIE